MKILFYDLFAGISGDMNLGALVDAGVPFDYLTAELKKLNVDGYTIRAEQQLKMGISGTRVRVELDHGHSHGHSHSHGHHHHHKHRNLHDIVQIIDKSSLNEFVRKKSKAIFEEIARAEAKIHAKTIDEIHFHEVGAIDSIVDSVGAAICIDYLKPERILASPVQLGGGFVDCAHGRFPVPAPATAEILTGIPTRSGAADQETTTPTGAAILKIFVDEFMKAPEFVIHKTAYGIGYRDLEIPNVLRVHLGETLAEKKKQHEAIMVACNIDDMNPEHYEFVMGRLFEAGAHDVFMTPIIMKKSRPGIQLNVLCDSSSFDQVESIILKETTSLGFRFYNLEKSMLERRMKEVQTRYGTIRIKEALDGGKAVKYKAEYADCAEAARNHKVTLQEVYNEIERIVNA